MRVVTWLWKRRAGLFLVAGLITLGATYWNGNFDGRTWRRVTAVAFTPDGQTIAACLRAGRTVNRDFRFLTADMSETIQLFDVATGRNERLVDHVYHSGIVGLPGLPGQAMAISPDSNTLAVGYWDGTVKLRSMHTLGLLRVLETHARHVSALAYSSDGQKLAACHGSWVTVWDMIDERGVSLPTNSMAGSVALSPVGDFLVIGDDWNRGAEMWNIATQQVVRLIPGTEFNVRAVGYSPDGRLVAIGGEKGCIVWDVTSDKVRFTLNADNVWSVAFSPNGPGLATAGETGVQLWDTRSGLPTGGVKSRGVRTLAYSSNGDRLAIGNSSGELAVWDAAMKSQLWSANVSKPWDIDVWVAVGFVTGLLLLTMGAVSARAPKSRSMKPVAT